MTFPTYVPATSSTVPAGVPAIAVAPAFSFSLWDAILLGFVLGLGLFLAKPVADLVISRVSREGLVTTEQLFWGCYLSTAANLLVQYYLEKNRNVNQPTQFHDLYARPGCPDDFKVHPRGCPDDFKPRCNTPRKRFRRTTSAPTQHAAQPEVDIYQIFTQLGNANPEAQVVPIPPPGANESRAAENAQQTTETPNPSDLHPPDNIADNDSAGSDVVVVPTKE